MTPREISRLLANQAESAAKHLLPGGKISGAEWVCGDTTGAAGKSCSVHLHGEKAGVWADFATGEGGDLLDLWQAARHVGIGEALRDAKAWLGVPDLEFTPKPKQWTKPKKPICNVPRDQGLAYLRQRGLSAKTISAYHVGERGDEIIFPFLRDGELVMAKARKAVDGEKPKPTESNCEKILFGWQAISEKSRDCLICEGEIDALSAFELGLPALSVPYGAGGGNKQDWIENEFDNLERFDQIYICMDRDQPGQEAVAEIVRRLGAHRCRVVEIPGPHKDVNDLLRAGWSAEQFCQLVGKAKMLDPAELRQASSYADQIVDEFYPPNGAVRGFITPWPKVERRLLFRAGEVVLLGGVNGHGKTEIAGNLALRVLKDGGRVCVASMEFKPHKWLKRITRQACGLDNPSADYVRAVANWYQDRLWVFDVVGTAKTDRMLEVFDYAVRRYRIQFFVVDNLAKCGFVEDDYNGQKAFVDKLTDFAKLHDVTILLVAHMRKGRDENDPRGKMDIKGSGALTDMVDTVLVIWRNKPKEDNLRDSPQDQETLEMADALLICEKQRNGEEEPRIALWFDTRSHQFVEKQGYRPMRVVDYTVTAFGQSA